jgi:serine/threonine protein kinase
MKTNHCPVCQSPIPENAPGGFCPACLLRDAEEAARPGDAAPSLAEIATAFPRLEVMELIGQGGMGFVYKVCQPDLDRTVALKILAPELGRDPAFAERFAREARTLGKLHHPNIVTIFEHGESGGYFYLLMEYVDGVNLRQAMRAGRFTPVQALAIVPGICDALQYAHEQGVWHRDIKPENILLDREGKVKIADFGIARIVGDPRRDFTLTLTGNALGSAAYMAPEQHEKPHDVDHRADIYSLGVVIYEMLTGELPLGRFPLPSQRAEVNARIDEIVLRTLEKERELRQQSASEVKTEVEGAGDVSPPRSGKTRMRKGTKVALIGCGGLLLLALLALLTLTVLSLIGFHSLRPQVNPRVADQHPRIEIRFTHPEFLSGGESFQLPVVVSKSWFPRSGTAISLKDARRVFVRARLVDVGPDHSAEVLVGCSSDGEVWETRGVPVRPGSVDSTILFTNGTVAHVGWPAGTRNGVKILQRASPRPSSGDGELQREKLESVPQTKLMSWMKSTGWMVHAGRRPLLLIAGEGTQPGYSGGAGGGKIDGTLRLGSSTLRIVMDDADTVNVNGSVFYLRNGRVLLVLRDGRVKQMGALPDHVLDDTEMDDFVGRLLLEIGYNYWTPELAVLSHIKAAERNDQAVFECGVSTRLIDRISKSDINVHEAMRKWSGLVFLNVIRDDGRRAIVRLAEKETKRGFYAEVVPFNDAWQIDSLEPVELIADSELAAEFVMEEILRAARARDKSAMKERWSRSLIAVADDDGELPWAFGQLDRMRFVKARNVDGTTSEIVVETSDGSARKFTFRMILEDGGWKLTEHVP